LNAAGNNSADDSAERELWQGSYSKLAMIGSWAAAAAFSLALLLWAALAGFGGSGWLTTLGVIVVVWIALVLRLLYLQLSRHYYLTSQRFSHERGLLWRDIDRIEAIDIDDVSFSQGPVERLLGVGTIRILSSDQSHPTMELPGIENVRAVASLIDEVRRQERRKRGLYVESV
jgi:membrane protein YdbS with pleckstrin-like domain